MPPKETQTETTETETETETSQEDKEKSYWDAFEARLDSWFEKKVKDVRSGSGTGTGDTRNPGSRRTLSSVAADLFFGDFGKK